MTVAFIVYGLPRPAGSKRAFQHRSTGRIVVTDANKNSRQWKDDVAQTAGHAMRDRELLEGPLRLSLVFLLPRPKGHYGKNGVRPSAPRFPIVKPDLLKLARGIEDAMSGVVYRDDAQIVTETLQKTYTPESAQVHVTVEQLSEEKFYACTVDESAGLALLDMPP